MSIVYYGRLLPLPAKTFPHFTLRSGSRVPKEGQIHTITTVEGKFAWASCNRSWIISSFRNFSQEVTVRHIELNGFCAESRRRIFARLPYDPGSSTTRRAQVLFHVDEGSICPRCPIAISMLVLFTNVGSESLWGITCQVDATFSLNELLVDSLT